MAIATAIAVGAVVAGTIASKVAADKANKKAKQSQESALKEQEKILASKLDPATINTLAKRADELRAVNRLALQEKLDPELAQLRTLSRKQLLEQAKTIGQPATFDGSPSGQLARQLFEENKNPDPRLEALKASILDNAEAELNAGATLPPEFQGELVRAGLTQASSAGVGLDRRSIGGNISRLLGIAGIQLKQQRQDQSLKLAEAAQGITNARANILATVFPKLKDLETANRANQRAETVGNLSIANQLLPESGLSGQDVANVAIAQAKGQANLAGQAGQIAAQSALAEGQSNQQLIGGLTSAVGIGAGGIGTSPGIGQSSLGVNYAIPGGSGAVLNTGAYGSRTAAQQANFKYLQSLYS